MFFFQMNVLQWEQANPPWVLPTYVGKFSQSLDFNRTWSVNDGAMTVLPLPRPPAASDGKYKVGVSDVELPSPQQVVPKLQQLENMKHVLNKGPWVVTPVVHQRWKVFIEVSCWFFLISASY